MMSGWHVPLYWEDPIRHETVRAVASFDDDSLTRFVVRFYTEKYGPIKEMEVVARDAAHAVDIVVERVNGAVLVIDVRQSRRR